MRRVVFILLLLLLPPLLRAQQDSPPRPRPKIGVALEGGGAMGLAHIGVLKWFEEHHIPVDYVAGTSMGGLVGGFYATGMSPDELKALIDCMDWRKILSDRTPYEVLAFRRKEDQRAYPNSLIFGLRDGLSLPAGLNAGHQIGLLIDRVTLPYDQVPSFDALPVPFRSVATDLVSRKPYVFKDGSLAAALRATMSIPGAFSPVHDGKAVFVGRRMVQPPAIDDNGFAIVNRRKSSCNGHGRAQRCRERAVFKHIGPLADQVCRHAAKRDRQCIERRHLVIRQRHAVDQQADLVPGVQSRGQGQATAQTEN